MGAIDILVFGCGVYILYHTFIMKRDGVIPQGVMINKGTVIPKDADVAGFILDMYWKGMVLGASACCSGIVGLLSAKNPQLHTAAIVFCFVFFAVLVGFVVFLKKAHKKFLHI